MGTILFVCTIILIAMVLLVLFYFNTMNEEKTKVVDIRSDLEKEIASLKKELKNAQYEIKTLSEPPDLYNSTFGDGTEDWELNLNSTETNNTSTNSTEVTTSTRNTTKSGMLWFGKRP